ncbi:hypothetical protein Aca07nite_19410 [Actinoplanes capillaceus]|uniref:Uncharacterized protein n=1 Tax=Actinoplanes campanulatus TaxID=113559 RepID=A0ABQ3WF94_9ACTN|nr:hypothetical protein [Actinoplanes capillaceus]GID44666.1 hypothetical protein Aca07nite_19410 [Actinoplanes capillaceus]
MSEPYMPHGWMHALVRLSEAVDTWEEYGTVVDEEGDKVKVRWQDETRTWEFKRDLAGLA